MRRTCATYVSALPGFEPPAGLANVRFIFIFFRQKYKIFNLNYSTAQQFNQSTQPATIETVFLRLIIDRKQIFQYF